ncbi:MAG: substrate-binding domain-containing protein, partial [Chloroflexi bacterium]|nr:substrate-binding domain-containing protein [Chloroflexota bacterium]
ESGNADVAFVYRTDAAIAGGLEVIDVVPVDSYPQIVYPALLMNGASNAAAEFFRFLSGERASAIFDARGFIVLDEGPEDERN